MAFGGMAFGGMAFLIKFALNVDISKLWALKYLKFNSDCNNYPSLTQTIITFLI